MIETLGNVQVRERIGFGADQGAQAGEYEKDPSTPCHVVHFTLAADLPIFETRPCKLQHVDR
ncbi:hypothetical protein [Aromatoleum petrolei]|uniref:Uncharacterized protein n=1 Tax=Aromatoleum petrolei TaxID=76116 RepID=A0ABX1MK62_9RHOO|nr:hypothetical protein [Aromatoleum petrolei]NMF88113.1 hypothetical protein [Aromatoleum petrolei]